MKKIVSILTSFIIVEIMFIGCSEHYSSPEYNISSDTINYNSEIDSVPIIIAMNDPYYATITRGMGPITSDIPENRDLATFYIYSFLTKNYAYNKGVDYTKKYKPQTNNSNNEIIYCLIDNPETGMGAETKLMTNDLLSFTDPKAMYFYNQRNQDYKYNFFAYHIDDAEIIGEGVVREKDKIRMDINIDGTQDIISAVADITDKQIQEINPNEDKLLLYNILNKELLYSAITGHRSIHPVFEAKHHLTRFVFNMVGESTMSDSIYIQDLYIMANRKCRFTVAADDFSQLNLVPLSKKLEEVHLCDETSDDGGVRSLESFKYSVKPNQKLNNLGLGIMLYPQENYDLYITCALKNEKTDKTLTYTAHYLLTNKTRTENNGYESKGFEAGTQYNVTMHVFGYKDIELRMDGLDWKVEADDIPIDEDDLKDIIE